MTLNIRCCGHHIISATTQRVSEEHWSGVRIGWYGVRRGLGAIFGGSVRQGVGVEGACSSVGDCWKGLRIRSTLYKSQGLSNCWQKGGMYVMSVCSQGSVRFNVAFGLCLVTFSSIRQCVGRWAFYSITLVRDSRWMVQCEQYELAGECLVGSGPWKIDKYSVQARLATYTCESTFVCVWSWWWCGYVRLCRPMRKVRARSSSGTRPRTSLPKTYIDKETH